VEAIAYPLSAFPALDAGSSIDAGGEELTKSDPGAYSTPGLPDPFLPPGVITVTGPGGASIGAFSVNVTDPFPLTWTNMAAGSTFDRSKGITVTWTGGTPGAFAMISGGVGVLHPSLFVSFQCVAPIAQGSFTIGPNVLLQLPASSANTSSLNLYVGDFEPYTSFAAPGLDYGYVTSGVAAYGFGTLQ